MKTLKFFILLFLILMTSCSGNVKSVSKKNQRLNKIKSYDLPAWLNLFPQNKSYLIGFAHKTNSRLKIIEEAKQSAAIFYCRNSEAYSVHKKALVRNYEENDVRFDLNVSANMKRVKDTIENLTVVDSCKIDNYFIYLFQNKKIPPKTKKIGKKYKVETSSADLIDALQHGFDEIRTQVAEYHHKSVITSTTISNENVCVKGELKTLGIISGLNLFSVKISSTFQESTLRYSVKITMYEELR